jgi:predicted 3-demethylubiquinone-9 3-methyltransferase (glyoxalase superfamily)
VFADSNLIYTEYYPASSDEGLADFQKDMADKILLIEFELNGFHFVAINYGPQFKFNEEVNHRRFLVFIVCYRINTFNQFDL